MTIDQVTVLNTDGTILASGGDTSSAAPGKMLSLEKTISKELQDNIAKTLDPYLGINNFEISVAARLNTDKRQTNETSYNPESRVERSVRVVKETGNSQNSANRIAGRRGAECSRRPAGARRGGDQSKKHQRAPRGAHQLRGELEDHLDGQRRLQDREPDDRGRGQSQAAAGAARRRGQR